jgi:hypothetical protein
MFPNETIMTQNLGRTNLTMIFNPSEKRINVVKTIINHPSVITYCINYSGMGSLLLFYPHYTPTTQINQSNICHMSITSSTDRNSTGK